MSSQQNEEEMKDAALHDKQVRLSAIKSFVRYQAASLQHKKDEIKPAKQPTQKQN